MKYLFEMSAYNNKVLTEEEEKERKKKGRHFNTWDLREEEVNVTVVASTDTEALAHAKEIVKRETYKLDTITELDDKGMRVDRQ